MFSLNLVNSILGAVNIFLIANLFGISRQLEVFFAASAVLYMLQSLTALGVFAEIFLPRYIETKKKEGVQAAKRAFNSFYSCFLALALLLAAIVVLCSDFLMGLRIPGFSASDKANGANILIALAPLIVFRILIGIQTIVINAEGKFGYPESMAVLARISNMTTLIIFSSVGVKALVLALWVGTGLQFLGISIIALRYSLFPKLSFSITGLQGFGFKKNGAATAFSIGGDEIQKLVTDAAVSFLPEGFYAILNYAVQIHDRAKGLLIKPISTVFFTQYSKIIDHSSAASKELIRQACRRFYAVCCFAHLGVIFLLPIVLAFLLPSSKFDEQAISMLVMMLSAQFTVLWITSNALIYRKVIAKTNNLYVFLMSRFVLSIACSIATWLLIREYGWFGAIAAFVMVGVFVFVLVLLVLYVRERQAFVLPLASDFFRWLAIFCCGYLFMTVGGSELGSYNQLLTLCLLGSALVIYVIFAGFLLRDADCRRGAEIVRNKLMALVKS